MVAFSLRVFSVCLALSAIGCGSNHPPVYPVTGVVTYNGTPVEGAEVVFSPQGEATAQAPSARTDAQGRYQLRTFFSAEVEASGAPPGTYKVLVTKIDMPPGIIDPYKPETPQPKALLPEAYSLPQKTPFTATVEAKSNDFSWALKD